MTLPHGQLLVSPGQPCKGSAGRIPASLRSRVDDASACDIVEIGRRCALSDSEQVNAMIERFLAASRSAAA